MLPGFPALVTALALLLYAGVFAAAALARARYGVRAPAVTGAPEFERALRVQQNTIEQLIWFLPALWLFAFYVSAFWGSVIGLVWIAGRLHYAVSYYRDPDARGPGFITGLVSSAALLLGALIGILVDLL
jgi:glutathione S-transferase